MEPGQGEQQTELTYPLSYWIPSEPGHSKRSSPEDRGCPLHTYTTETAMLSSFSEFTALWANLRYVRLPHLGSPPGGSAAGGWDGHVTALTASSPGHKAHSVSLRGASKARLLSLSLLGAMSRAGPLVLVIVTPAQQGDPHVPHGRGNNTRPSQVSPTGSAQAEAPASSQPSPKHLMALSWAGAFSRSPHAQSTCPTTERNQCPSVPRQRRANPPSPTHLPKEGALPSHSATWGCPGSIHLCSRRSPPSPGSHRRRKLELQEEVPLVGRPASPPRHWAVRLL